MSNNKTTENNVMKDYYRKNQEYFDKAVLALILAMPPFLVFIFQNIVQKNTELKSLFLWILAISFLVIILYLVAFILARNGCNNLDYAESLENDTEAKQFIESEKNRLKSTGLWQTKLADIIEYIYLFLIGLILIGIFIGFYKL